MLVNVSVVALLALLVIVCMVVWLAPLGYVWKHIMLYF